MFPRDMVYLRNVNVNTPHKEDTEDNNNNNVCIIKIVLANSA
jgi:hypothetical protein